MKSAVRSLMTAADDRALAIEDLQDAERRIQLTRDAARAELGAAYLEPALIKYQGKTYSLTFTQTDFFVKEVKVDENV